MANLLSRKGVEYTVEPKFTIGYHNYYPDFLIHGNNQKIIEVMGVGTEEYWKKGRQKIKSLLDSYPEMDILVITSYSKKARTHLEGIARVNILLWKELEGVASWCRSVTPG